MCDPFIGLPTAAALATSAAGAAASVGTAVSGIGAALGGLQGVGTLVSAGGSILGGIQQGRTARQNAALASQQAQDVRNAAITDENRTRREFSRQLGTQRAQLAAQGIGLDSVSALLLGDDAVAEQEFEAQQIRSGGLTRAVALDTESRLYRAQGTKARIGGFAGAVQPLISAPPALWKSFGVAAGAT